MDDGWVRSWKKGSVCCNLDGLGNRNNFRVNVTYRDSD